ncbi:MAG: Ni-sirohydrochlorin a,c-diamide synthase [Methanolinea sp.]|nr:Ni-sirohydrochlorin a,c-diamide synthase [Methanolinea sp.]
MRTLLIAGDRSGSGKTSITLAIAQKLSRKMSVQTFKVGMDYIDPSYLTGVTGRPCRNLDTFVMDENALSSVFTHACHGADIAIIEGVRGLYEGAEPTGDAGSTASVAKALGVPVVLVVNARSITRSAAALVRGFQSFDPQIHIAGVILNNVAGEKHAEKTRTAIEHYCKVPVLGAVPRLPALEMAMRHLGLVPFREGQDKGEFMERIRTVSDLVGGAINLDRLLSLAADVSPGEPVLSPFLQHQRPDLRIAVAYDHVFTFYYADLFDILKANGAEVTFFSPAEGTLPDADGYIIGGGYPELYARELSDNTPVREALRQVSREGVPIYAECAGLMYLTDEIVLKKGWQEKTEEERYPLCGVFRGKASMPARRVVAYVEGESKAGSPVGAHRFRGHEFHYSDVSLAPGTRFAYTLTRGKGIEGKKDGATVRNTLASYTHLHPVGSLPMFVRFLETCRQAQESRNIQSAGKK